MVCQGELAKELQLQEELCLDPGLTQDHQAWGSGATLQARSWAGKHGEGAGASLGAAASSAVPCSAKKVALWGGIPGDILELWKNHWG